MYNIYEGVLQRESVTMKKYIFLQKKKKAVMPVSLVSKDCKILPNKCKDIQTFLIQRRRGHNRLLSSEEARSNKCLQRRMKEGNKCDFQASEIQVFFSLEGGTLKILSSSSVKKTEEDIFINRHFYSHS